MTKLGLKDTDIKYQDIRAFFHHLKSVYFLNEYPDTKLIRDSFNFCSFDSFRVQMRAVLVLQRFTFESNGNIFTLSLCLSSQLCTERLERMGFLSDCGIPE